MLAGPQISAWIKSKQASEIEVLNEKDNFFYLAKWQVSQGTCSFEQKMLGLIFCKDFILEFDKWPNL